jgi:rhodanese-related sulfurtransferase
VLRLKAKGFENVVLMTGGFDAWIDSEYPVEVTTSTSSASAATTTHLASNPPYETLVQNGYNRPEIPRLTCEELKKKMDGGSTFILIDTRDETVFKKGHIAGAIDIPVAGPEETVNGQLTALPKDKLIIVYCDCAFDSKSADLAQKLIDKGYNIANIRVLWKGYFKWLQLGYPIETE